MRAVLQLITLLVAGTIYWTQSPEQKLGEIHLKLVDGATQQLLPGLVTLRNEQGEVQRLAGLLPRGLGLDATGPIHDWYVVRHEGATLSVPEGRYKLQALHGIETLRAEHTLDVVAGTTRELRVPLTRFYHAEQRGLYAGNTHLHLRKISRPDADRYIREIPAADGLAVLFVSYLERAEEDRDYVSNQYSKDDLQRLSTPRLPIGWGEEHRHNFTGWGQGFGHVMLLGLPELIQPVSIGPGIMKTGTDSVPLQRGIDRSRALGATVIWCHDQWGYEDIPNWVLGRLQANNIFDGGLHGSYRHSFYRYLNAGIKVPFSTGTDWFQYDFSRVYVPSTTRPSTQQWLDQLVAGRSTITNGTLLELTVDGAAIGATLALDVARKVKVVARGMGRTDFEHLEVIRNGEVIQQLKTVQQQGHFTAEGEIEVSIKEPCWFALRTPPPPWKGDAEQRADFPKNELGNPLFAHTSAIYVTLNGRSVFDRPTVEGLLEEMRDHRRIIHAGGKFADDGERQRVLAVYDEAIARTEARMAASK